MTSKIAFVFPGQGSQAVGMLDSFEEDHPEIVKSVCLEASNVLGYDMYQLIASDPDNRLNQTEYTQPALLTAGYIAWKIWQAECTEQPVYLAGHSLGEYTALVCSGALSFAGGLRLVAKRGELMQSAVPPGTGAMAAILGLELDQIIKICDNVGNGLCAVPNLGNSHDSGDENPGDASDSGIAHIVQPANLNAPGQIVIAGTSVAVDLAIEQAKIAGAKRAIILPVSVPSHCKLMQPAAEGLSKYLEAIDWQKPRIPVIHNYDVKAHSDSKEICQVLAQQLCSPVRWIETIGYVVQQGVEEIIECGPGKILTGLNKRIAPDVKTRAIVESLGAGLC